MVITIKLYGDLREKLPHLKDNTCISGTLNFDVEGIETVSDVLNKLNITQEEISHIFVNHKYSRDKREVKNGDRIGIFPKRMGIIFVEIMNE
ncbi:MAG: MoaD/ThiS family protein [Candidatus Hermodarchaeota archaeon]